MKPKLPGTDKEKQFCSSHHKQFVSGVIISTVHLKLMNPDLRMKKKVS